MKSVTRFAFLALIPILVSPSHSSTSYFRFAASQVDHAIAVIHPLGANKVSGWVRFKEVRGGVEVTADISGLTPGRHGFHVHEFGDCSAADGSSAGGHFNPSAEPHGAPGADKRHTGDLGNLEADETGRARLTWVDKHLSLSGRSSIIGRSVVIHEKVDDLVSQPAGNSGPRIGCGVIGRSKGD